jgi:hypothetical protein
LGKRKKFGKTEKCKKLEIYDKFLTKKKKVCNTISMFLKAGFGKKRSVTL